MSELPEPFVSVEADLKDFPFTPMYRARLFGSDFHAKANDAEWRAGVTLWLKSQDQVPAGSLPDDDIALCRLAELGRDMRAWRKVKETALHGWKLCSDGRLYHPVVASIVIEQLQRKQARRDRTEAARVAREQKRLLQSLSQTSAGSVTDNVTTSVTDSKGQGQGQGHKERKKEDAVPDGTAAEAANGHDDLAAEVFTLGVRILTRRGVPERQARTIIGGHRKTLHDDAKLLTIMASVERNNPVEPIGYLAKAITQAAKPFPGWLPNEGVY